MDIFPTVSCGVCNDTEKKKAGFYWPTVLNEPRAFAKVDRVVNQ